MVTLLIYTLRKLYSLSSGCDIKNLIFDSVQVRSRFDVDSKFDSRDDSCIDFSPVRSN
jgi:hypothetical protein